MTFSEPVRMAEDDGGTPSWARPKRRRGGSPVINFLVTLLALFGALTAVLGVKEQSVAEGGVIIDSWISAGWQGARRLAGQAPEAAEAVVDKAGAAVATGGEALQPDPTPPSPVVPTQ